MSDLIPREAAIEALGERPDNWTDTPEEVQAVRDWDNAVDNIKFISSVPAVPLDKLCELLAEMYHCPSSGWPSSGRACHPGCPDEAFEKLCGTDCESYSDVERWRAFLTKWMEGLDVSR